MNSRERTTRAVSFGNPDRIPIRPEVTAQYWLTRTEQECSRLADYLNSLSLDCPPIVRRNEKALRRGHGERTWKDSWGCTWEEGIPGEFGTVIDHPLADWDQVEHYRFPDDMPDLRPEANPDPDLYRVCGGVGRYGVLWYQMQFLRGYEGIMMDLAANPERAGWLRDRILEKRMAYLRKVLELRPDSDAIAFGDCWGAQNALMISPVQWREVFKPAYQQLFDIVRDAGKKVYFQSDGYTLDIIEDLLDIGVDILRISVGMMDIPTLGKMLRGKACLFADPCRQHIMPKGTPEEVRAHIRAIISAFATPAGGLLGGLYIDEGVPLENVKAAMETYIEYGERPR
jgi:uroporphyrinogen decarboxylase